ncbi:MAG: YwaF family protein, partial [Clostridia bacterium]|nr:YwaF family protein [Clostridia bacterium]
FMFLDTVDTLQEGMGFDLFGKLHLIWLAVFVVAAVTLSIIYRKLSPKARNIMRITVASLIIADEIYKWIFLFIGDRYEHSYLPLHLCSINVFLVAFHIFKRSKLIENFLYVICVPAAIIALLTPSWTALPPGNFMHIHSFTIHILLGIYPIMLLAGGDIKPELKMAPKCLLLLLCMGVIVLGVNFLCDTNFMFLMRTDDISFLVLFENIFGAHQWAFPILLPIVLAVMYLPIFIANKLKKNKKIICKT